MGESDQPSVRDMATAWFVRLRDDNVTDDEKARFRTWLEADAAHAEAYQELERLWAGLDEIGQGEQRLSAPPPVMAEAGRRSVLRNALAASVVLVIAIGSYGVTALNLLADHRTGTGEQRQIVLQDGSAVHLNTATALSVEFGADRRLITLHAGEAYFEVAGNPDRPFIVETGMGRVEALGTAFAVRHIDGGTDVLVTESRVAVSAPTGDERVLGEGEGISVTDTGLGSVTTGHAPQIAWREGRLVFENRPLGDVLREIDRYRRGTVVVLDGATSALPVTGAFSISDTDETLDIIEQTLPVRVFRVSNLLVMVGAGS